MPETPGHSSLRNVDDRPVIARGGGARTVRMITPETGAGMLNGFTVMPPGTGIPLHFHDCEESVLVLSGRATVEIDGQQHPAGAGDVVWIAPGLHHRFSNAGDSDLRIFWTYASAAATRTIVATGETGPVMAE
jgi:quercetin dioxygenase-like cupin family protein